MGRKSDRQIWLHWDPVDQKHVSCVFCNYTIVKHATRCKEHTMMCHKAPIDVREAFRCQHQPTGLTRQMLSESSSQEIQLIDIVGESTITPSTSKDGNARRQQMLQDSSGSSSQVNVDSSVRASLGNAVNPVVLEQHFTAPSSPQPAKNPDAQHWKVRLAE